jgi:hypothetical protein
MAGNPARVRDLHELGAIWRRRRLHVMSMPGWEDHGREGGNTFDVLGCHHVGSGNDMDRLLWDGRPAEGIPGPLCNVALHKGCPHAGDWLADVVFVASGRANHFGVATWPSGRALGVEATGPPFTNYDAYVQLAAGFLEWKGQPTALHVVRNTTIPVYLVAAHKEVAQPYGRKPNPAGEGFNNGGRVIAGVMLIDDFRRDVAAAVEGGDWLTMATQAEYEASLRKILFGEAIPAEVKAGSVGSKIKDIQIDGDNTRVNMDEVLKRLADIRNRVSTTDEIRAELAVVDGKVNAVLAELGLTPPAPADA